MQQAIAATSSALSRGFAQDFWDAGVAQLLAGETDTAVSDLSKAAALSPKDARFWNDLATAHLQRGAARSDPYEFVLALSAANRAILLDSGLLEARFNRALSLERLGLRDRAAADWDFVASREPDRLWQREVKDRAATLAKSAAAPDWKRQSAEVEAAVAHGTLDRIPAIVAGSPQRFREYLEEELLGEWAATKRLRREPEASRKLAIAKSIADALVANGGDRMAADTIGQLVGLETRNPLALRKLAAGLSAYSEGLALAGQAPQQAETRFEKAHALLAGQGSPFALWASYRIALCQYQVTDYRRARRGLEKLVQDPKVQRYRALLGRSFHLIGLIDGLEGKHTAPIDAFERAEEALQEVHEAPNAAKSSALLAQNFDALGKRDEAWRRLQPALVAPGLSANPEIRAVAFECASELAYGEGDVEIASWFQEEVVKSLDLMNRPDFLIPPLCKQASLLASLGRNAEAGRQLTRARDLLLKIPEPAYRRTLEGDLLLAEAELASRTTPQQAIAKLDQAIPIFRDTLYHYRIGHAFYLRAIAERTLGQTDAAERDLADAIAELERQREAIIDPGDRISYLDRLDGLFDSMIGLQLEQRKRPDVALRFSEQAKARVLWDWVLTSPSRQSIPAELQQAAAPLDLAALQRSLPAGTSVVEYAALPDRIVLWVVHREGDAQYETVATSTAALEELVQRFRRTLLDHDSKGLERISAQLYDLVVRPAARHLKPGERLVLIPDGPLHVLPFALLRDRQSGKYLVQDHVLTVAPSLRVYVAGRRRDSLLASGRLQALVAAAPDFDPKIDPSLTTQTYGPADAAIADLFPGSQVIKGETATREAFLEAAGDFEIVHFGGHSVVNTESPLLSMMLFARNTADPAHGVLYSGDVLRLKLPRTRLLTLASCGTGNGRISRTEGVESLARPFLAVGVPTVVASLWTVNDKPTAELFALFYQKLAERFDPPGALRSAQVELIERQGSSDSKPWNWGAFEVIGGGAPD